MTGFFASFKEGMTEFGKTISSIVNSFLLVIIYIVGIGLTSIISKLIFKKHFLDIENSDYNKSYWSDLNLNKRPIEEYYRQF